MKQNFEGMYKGYHLDELLKTTKYYVGRLSEVNSTSYVAYYYRIKTLIFLAEFDEAKDLCEQVIKKSQASGNKASRFAYLYLSQIYHYRNEFIKAIYFYKKYMDLCENIDPVLLKKNKDQTIRKLLIESNIPFVNNKDNIKARMRRYHSEDFGERWSIYKKIVDAVMDNFNNATCYYEGKLYVRFFRCQGVTMENSNNTSNIKDYLKVSSYSDSPDTIVSIYAVKSVGDLDYIDITQQFNKLKGNSRKKELGSIAKFYLRQAKKKK